MYGIASRRAADDLISQGRVELNGKTVTELGTKANPDQDEIRVDGRRLKVAPVKRYLLMYKPAGVVATRSDPQRRQTVIDLVAAAGVTGYFYPVGRLDYDSEGLIILTNDGEFAERVSHPRYEMDRTYEAVIEGIPDERDIERLRKGMLIDGRRTLPARVKQLRVVSGKRGTQAVLEFVIREGRNRQVRKMCDAIAHPVATSPPHPHRQRHRLGVETRGFPGPDGRRDPGADEARCKSCKTHIAPARLIVPGRPTGASRT